MPAQRRTRYTVTHRTSAGIKQAVVLGYSLDGIRIHMIRCGYDVTKVVKGDYRAAPRAVAQSGGTGWKLDRRALNAAAKSLGLKLPVHIKTNSKYGGTNGTYRFKDAAKAPRGFAMANASAYHNIVIKSYLTPQQATETMWHELQHAVQAERAGSVIAWNAFTRDQKRYSYKRRPIEIEARRVASANAHKMLAL